MRRASSQLCVPTACSPAWKRPHLLVASPAATEVRHGQRTHASHARIHRVRLPARCGSLLARLGALPARHMHMQQPCDDRLCSRLAPPGACAQHLRCASCCLKSRRLALHSTTASIGLPVVSFRWFPAARAALCYQPEDATPSASTRSPMLRPLSPTRVLLPRMLGHGSTPCG
jgi:hypothetical protein